MLFDKHYPRGTNGKLKGCVGMLQRYTLKVGFLNLGSSKSSKKSYQISKSIQNSNKFSKQALRHLHQSVRTTATAHSRVQNSWPTFRRTALCFVHVPRRHLGKFTFKHWFLSPSASHVYPLTPPVATCRTLSADEFAYSLTHGMLDEQTVEVLLTRTLRKHDT